MSRTRVGRPDLIEQQRGAQPGSRARGKGHGWGEGGIFAGHVSLVAGSQVGNTSPGATPKPSARCPPGEPQCLDGYGDVPTGVETHEDVAPLNDRPMDRGSTSKREFSDLSAPFIHRNLKCAPEISHMWGLIDTFRTILRGERHV